MGNAIGEFMNDQTPIRFDNSYARLPDRFFARVAPTAAPEPEVLRINAALAELLNIDADWLATAEGLAALSGAQPLPGAEPLAMAYAGHQFGQFVPQLGDGRALLLGEVLGQDDIRYDIQLKGSGRTPFSRGGDGRAVLGPVLREYIVGEAMASLGVPTTRGLAAYLTGEDVMRDGLEPGAVFVRVAQSHVRVGTFQYFAVRGDTEGLRALADYVIARHYPAARYADAPYLELFRQVLKRQAALIAKWQSIGFIHGVMNTDNMSIAGETIDYGPCAFMDTYHPQTVFSSIDRQGRYAYGNQPAIAQWNLMVLAQSLLPLMHDDPEQAVGPAQEVLNTFPEEFENAYLARMREKLGLTQEEEGDDALIKSLFDSMAQSEADFTLTFRHLSEGEAGEPYLTEGVREWLPHWQARLEREPASPDARLAAMRSINPLYVPRNHLVEKAIQAALKGDLSVFDELMTVLARPFDAQDGRDAFARPPAPEEVVHQTFCGT